VIIVCYADIERSSSGLGPQRRAGPVERRGHRLLGARPGGSSGSRPAAMSAGSCSSCWRTCHGRTGGPSLSTSPARIRTARSPLLARASRDTDGVADELRDYITGHLGDIDAVLAVDETGDERRG
jgi:hypothetical protein